MNVYRFFLLYAVAVIIPPAAAVPENVKSVRQGVTFTDDSQLITISCLGERVIRVESRPSGSKTPRPSLVVDDSQLPFDQYRLHHENGTVVLETASLKAAYDPSKKAVVFTDAKTNQPILSEKERNFHPVEILGDKAFTVKQTFTLSPGEAIYGLGQYQEGLFNYRGKEVKLVHANCEIANPVLLSTNNYLLYWDNYSKTIFSDNKDGASFDSEMGDGINYYFVYGGSMNASVAEFRKLTGQAPMLPKSAFGFWISKERYRSFDELTNVVKEYRKRRIPLDNVVQDWQYWGTDNGYWNSMEFEPKNFPNPQKAIADLHDKYNVKLTVSVWPGVGKKTEIYKAMEAAKALFDVPTWAGYKIVDIYNPKAQEIYWDFLCKGLYSKGVDSWWMDATEPSFKDGLYQDKQEKWTKAAGMTHIGPFHRYLNTYSLFLSKVMYDNLRKQSDKRVSILTRSAFAGQQKYGTSTWSGDIYASWDVLAKQISAGLNFCMTGIPYWTTDIGGFRVVSSPGKGGAGEIDNNGKQSGKSHDGGYKGGLKNPAYLELYTRWFQYGVFCPMFRAHGTEVPREIWNFGEPGTPWYDAQIDMINLRYSLLSYIYSNAWLVTSQGATMMRPMVMDFTSDKTVHNNAAGFMFGEALLVYPVTKPMFYDKNGKIENTDTHMPVYLPTHEDQWWYDLNSDACFAAGREIAYDAPLNVIPVFAKGGSIVPRNKPVPYANDDDNREMEIVVYTGGDSNFALYEDDNETYAYEKGRYSIIRFQWDERNKTLSILAPEGKLPPRHQQRTFHVKFVSPSESGKTATDEKQIIYQNKPILIIK